MKFSKFYDFSVFSCVDTTECAVKLNISAGEKTTVAADFFERNTSSRKERHPIIGSCHKDTLGDIKHSQHATASVSLGQRTANELSCF